MKINHNEVHPYPAYQKSSLPWVEKIPQHWRITNVKRHFQVRIGKMLTTEPQTPTDVEVPYLKALNVQWNVVNTNNVHTMWASQDEARQLEIRPGDLLVCEGGEGGRAAIVIDPPKGFIFQNALHRVRAKHGSLNPYLLRVMYGIASSGWFDALNNKATIAHFTKEKFEALVIPIPPLDEQAAIVRYLDHADELINRYISAKERLIALLEEQRQAVIQQTVTRGLHSTTLLKQSGVPWIGEIPRDWNVRRLRTLVDISTGGRDTINSVDDGQYPFFVRSQTVERINTWSFDGEAVLTAGDGVGVGRVFHYINGKFDYHQRVYKFSGFTGIAGRLFHHYFSAMLRFQTSQGTAKSTVDSLRLPMLQNFPVVVPPPHIQAQLVQQLDRITSSAEEAIEIANRQIDLTNEYRTRLIADVVTGQIDVRHAAVELHV